MRKWLPVLASCAMLPSLHAQGLSRWQPGDGVPGVMGTWNTSVRAMTTWDPDGAGPLAPQLVVGGAFEVAGRVAANGLARCDLTTGEWTAFGLVESRIEALLALPNGDLVAAGIVGLGVGTKVRVARWDGTRWTPLGNLPQSTQPGASVLAVLPNGDLLLGGQALDGNAATSLMRWDGVAWSSLGAFGSVSVPLLPPFVTDPVVTALQVMPNGDLVVGGLFVSVGGVATQGIARWNGSTWSALGSGLTYNTPWLGVGTLALAGNGDLLVCGSFTAAGGIPVPGVAAWDGSAWLGLGVGAVSGGSPAVLANGRLVATRRVNTGTVGYFTEILVWSGSAWVLLGDTGHHDGVSSIACFHALGATGFVVGGNFASIGGVPSLNVALFDAVTGAWTGLGSGTNGPVRALLQMPSGDLLAGGSFRAIGGTAASCVARRSGGVWQALGTGIDAPLPGAPQHFEAVHAIAVLPNGDVVVAGTFSGAGGVAASNIARWDGTAWHPLGSGTNNTIQCLAVLANGDLIAGGWFTMAGGVAAEHIARWDGTAWHSFGQMLGGSGGNVVSMLVRANGDLVVAGSFAYVDGLLTGPVARWDGSQWARVGPVPTSSWGGARALHETPDHRLLACGPVAPVNEFDGQTWVPVGDDAPAGAVRLLSLPNGDLVAVGGGGTLCTVALWDGVRWRDLAPIAPGRFEAAELTADGELVVGGTFVEVDAVRSPFLARWRSLRPAFATPYGAGCTGSGGTDTLIAIDLPWQGGVFRGRADGLAAPGLAISVLGVAPAALPLDSLFAEALPGCDLLAAPDRLALHVTNGSLVTQWIVAASPSLLGAPVYHQVVSAGFDAQAQIDEITATNALRLTPGTY